MLEVKVPTISLTSQNIRFLDPIWVSYFVENEAPHQKQIGLYFEHKKANNIYICIPRRKQQWYEPTQTRKRNKRFFGAPAKGVFCLLFWLFNLLFNRQNSVKYWIDLLQLIKKALPWQLSQYRDQGRYLYMTTAAYHQGNGFWKWTCAQSEGKRFTSAVSLHTHARCLCLCQLSQFWCDAERKYKRCFSASQPQALGKRDSRPRLIRIKFFQVDSFELQFFE